MATFSILINTMKKARALHLQGSSLRGSFQMRWNFRLDERRFGVRGKYIRGFAVRQIIEGRAKILRVWIEG